jgi:hypothetical protein
MTHLRLMKLLWLSVPQLVADHITALVIDTKILKI